MLYTTGYLQYGDGQGGGVFVSNPGTFTASGVTFQGNSAIGATARHRSITTSAKTPAPAKEARIYDVNGTVVLENQTTLTHNTAVGGRGGDSNNDNTDLSGKGTTQGAAFMCSKECCKSTPPRCWTTQPTQAKTAAGNMASSRRSPPIPSSPPAGSQSQSARARRWHLL